MYIQTIPFIGTESANGSSDLHLNLSSFICVSLSHDMNYSGFVTEEASGKLILLFVISTKNKCFLFEL